MAVTQDQLDRGRELRAMSDKAFLKLWDTLRHHTPNELNEIEPFYIVIAIERLREHVGG